MVPLTELIMRIFTIFEDLIESSIIDVGQLHSILLLFDHTACDLIVLLSGPANRLDKEDTFMGYDKLLTLSVDISLPLIVTSFFDFAHCSICSSSTLRSRNSVISITSCYLQGEIKCLFIQKGLLA
jgi:hypothetical protein